MTETWTEEALEWTRGTWSLDQVRTALEQDFGLVRKRNSVRNLFVDLGIEPAIKMGSRDSGLGRVAYYDRLVTWVAYVAYHCDGDERANLALRLDEYRDQASNSIWGKLAYAPKKRDQYLNLAWDWRVESTAYHLFISDVRHGLEPRRLHDLLARRPDLLNLTLDGNWCLESILRGYLARYIGGFTGVLADPNNVNVFAGGRASIYEGRIASSEPIEILRQFCLLEPDGRKLSEPSHVHFDEPDIYSEEDL